MKLAVNYSPQLDELIRVGQAEVDLLKCADWPELVEPAQKLGPVYVHFPIHAGDGKPVDWNAVREWMDLTDTRKVNMHLIATTKDFPDIPFTSRSAEHRDRVIEAMVRDVLAAGKVVGVENIVVENLPTVPADDGVNPLHCAVEIDTIRAVIEQTGCGLLLDIDHARSAADVLNVDPRTYMDALPVDRMGELHMTGCRRIGNAILGHLPMNTEDWEFFDWAIERFRSGAWKTPDIYAFEYGGIGPIFRDNSDIKVLGEQVPMLLAKVRSLNT